MTETEHLLTIVSEECSEIAQRVSKALRFGLDEREPRQPLTNAERIALEVVDLFAVLEMLSSKIPVDEMMTHKNVQAKKDKVQEYILYSADCGTLQAAEV